MKKLENIVNIVQDILKEKINLFEYKENNNRTFASFEIKEKLTPKEKAYIKGKINNDVYHLNIDNGDDTKTIIEIHLKHPLEQDLSLERKESNDV